MDDESGELMELMEEVPLKELGDAKLERSRFLAGRLRTTTTTETEADNLLQHILH